MARNGNHSLIHQESAVEPHPYITSFLEELEASEAPQPEGTAQPQVSTSVNEARGFILYVGLREEHAHAHGGSLVRVVQSVRGYLQQLAPDADLYAAIAMAPANTAGTDLELVREAGNDPSTKTAHPAPPNGHPDPLVRAKVRRDLADLDYRREVAAAAGVRKQVEIARATGTTQGNVSHLLSKRPAPVLDEFHGATPYELCQRHAAGQISDDELVKELSRWPYRAADTRTNGYDTLLVPVSGSFDDVDLALDQGLIPDEIYGRIYEALEGS